MPTLTAYEGFDLVGKTTLAEATSVCPVYRTDYSMLDRNYGRNLTALFFYGQADLLSFLSGDLDCHIPGVSFDRWIFSSYVYSRMYPDRFPEVSVVVIRECLERMSETFGDIIVVHVSHDSRESAEEMYGHYLSDQTRRRERFDVFDSFDDYWETYSEAEWRFSEAYEVIEDFIVTGGRETGRSAKVEWWSSYPTGGDIGFRRRDVP